MDLLTLICHICQITVEIILRGVIKACGSASYVASLPVAPHPIIRRQTCISSLLSPRENEYIFIYSLARAAQHHQPPNNISVLSFRLSRPSGTLKARQRFISLFLQEAAVCMQKPPQAGCQLHGVSKSILQHTQVSFKRKEKDTATHQPTAGPFFTEPRGTFYYGS